MMKVLVWTLIGIMYVMLFGGVVLTALTAEAAMVGLSFSILGSVMLVAGTVVASMYTQTYLRRRRALREIERLIKDNLFLRK